MKMAKLTQREKDFLIEAAELIDDDINTFSCNAVDKAVNRDRGVARGRTQLRGKYAAFYGKTEDEAWFTEDEYEEGDISEDRQTRVLLLLTFAELG
jgi:hypothetical protein